MKRIYICIQEEVSKCLEILSVKQTMLTSQIVRNFALTAIGFWLYSAVKIIILLIIDDNLQQSPLPYLIVFGLPSLIILIRIVLTKCFKNYAFLIMKFMLILIYYSIVAYLLLFNANDRTSTMHAGVIFLMMVQFNLIFVNNYFKVINQAITIIMLVVANQINSDHTFLEVYDIVENSLIIFLLLLFIQQYNNDNHELKFNDYLDNIPTAICILNKNANDILYQNNQIDDFISTKHKKEEILEFFKTICIPIEDLKKKFPNVNFEDQYQEEEEASEPSRQMIDLHSVLIQMIVPEKASTYMFRCELVIASTSNSQFINDRKIIDVKIKKGLPFGKQESILIVLYDVSTHLQSTYYQNLNIFKSRLIKSISHELRTRLNIIQGMISVLINSYHNFDNHSKMLLQASYNNCRIQTYLIGGIIDYNLLQDNQISAKLSKCTLKQLIVDAISLFQEEADMKHISIIFQNYLSNDKFMSLDTEKVMTCLVNILSNSVKFTQQHGVINISLSADNNIHNTPQNHKNQTSIQRISVKSLSRSYNKFSSENQSEKYREKRSAKRTLHLKSIISRKSAGLTSRKNSNLPIRFKISISDSGIGVKEQKLKKIQSIISGNEDNLENYSKDSADGFMMGVRVIQKLLTYINGESLTWWSFESFENQGTTVVMYIKAQQLYNSYQISYQLSEPNQFDSIEEEGHVSRTNCMMNFHHSTHMQLDIYNQKLNTELQRQKTCCKCEEEILIVDDEPYNLLILEQLFKCLNQRVIKADDGKQAYDVIEKRIMQAKKAEHQCNIFKAILMDYQMPIMNGEVATREIIKLCFENDITSIPIFGCTGFSSSEDIQQLITCGMKEVFTKPITKHNLEDILNRLNSGEFRDKQNNFILSPSFHCENMDLEDAKLI